MNYFERINHHSLVQRLLPRYLKYTIHDKSTGCTLVRLAALFTTTIIFAAVSGYAQSQVVQGEYIIKIKSQKGATSNSRLSKGVSLIKKMGSAVHVKQAFWGSTMMHIKTNSQASLDQLRADPEVEFIEPNYKLTIDPVEVQPFGTAPGAFDSYDQSYADVQVTDSWAVAMPYNQGTKTVVAVIDTGLDMTHALFADSGAIWQNTAELNGTPGVDDDSNGYIDDINGWNYVSNSGSIYDDDDHGTHVAGIVLGVGQDILQSSVRESKIKIMPLKFLDANGSGTTANAVSAIYYAVNMGAKVINNSWGGSSYSRSLHDAYTYAHTNGVVIASAAGNSGSDNDTTPMYPAALDTPNNIAVAASTDSDNKASFSNYGLTVHVAAPGVAIVSSVPGNGCPSPGCFQMMSGTSMASPFVAGLAALLIREAPQLSGYQVRSIILSSTNTFSSLINKVSTSGRVNALLATQAAIAQAGTAAYNPSYTPVYKTERSVASDSAPTDSGGGGCGLVKALGAGASSFLDGSGSDSSGGMGTSGAILAMILLPVLLAVGLRRKTPLEVQQIQRRQYARYTLAKDLVLKIGDQVITTASDTLSLGGVSFSGTLQMNKGEKIKVKIEGLDQEMDGEVVWCSQKQSYGVKFLNITDQLRAQFSTWTLGLSPT